MHAGYSAYVWEMMNAAVVESDVAVAADEEFVVAAVKLNVTAADSGNADWSQEVEF